MFLLLLITRIMKNAISWDIIQCRPVDVSEKYSASIFKAKERGLAYSSALNTATNIPPARRRTFPEIGTLHGHWLEKC
jgi:hypothetical protein